MGTASGVPYIAFERHLLFLEQTGSKQYGNDEEGQKDEEQHFCYRSCACRDASKSKDGRDNGDNKEYNRPA
jgi:hypothetical protein